MKKMSKVLSLALCPVILLGLVTACAPKEKALTTVRVAIHGNECGASLGGVAVEQGFFEEYGIKAEITIVESGPAEMAAMRADSPTLDIGYIGSGVAWNPIDGSGNSITFVFPDILTNAEKLLAKEGIFKDTNGNGAYDNDEILEGLKGQTVYLELGTTPADYFKSLLRSINDGQPESEQLWLYCEDASYLSEYTAPNDNPELRVMVVNYQNANIAAGMATSGADSVSVAVAYAPVTNTILKTVSGVEAIAEVTNLPASETYFSTWVANTEWLKANPELAQNFVNALYKAAVYRGEHPEESMTMGEKVSQKPAGSFDANNALILTKSDFEEWFADKDSRGYQIMRGLYEKKKSDVPEGSSIKSFEEAFDDSYFIKAIKEVK